MRTEILKVIFDREPWRNHVERLCAQLWDGTTADEIIQDPRLLFFSAGEDALIIIEVVIRTAGRELFVLGLVGSGIFRNADSIIADLRALRAAWQCRWIGGHVIRKGLAKLYERLGAREVSRYYLMEV